MNDLIGDMSTDVPISDICHSDNCLPNESLKRSRNCEQSYDKKRIKDEELGSDPVLYHLNDSRLYADENEEEPYVEMTEEERLLMNISNQLINFNINMKHLDWEEFLNSEEYNSKEVSVPKSVKSEFVFPPETGEVIHGYCLETLVSASKRIAIYVGFKVKTPEERVIIKIGFEMGFHSLQNECNIYTKLKTLKTIPKLLDYLWWRVYREDYSSIRWGFIILEKCGPNLVDLMKSSTFGVIKPMENVFEFVIKMIDSIEAFHEKGFLHLSLKPEHFVFESDFRSNLKLIGLSASKSFLKKCSNGSVEHIENQVDRKLPKGDPNFHSIGYHNGFRRSRRDDMESLGYCILFMINGTLPWINPLVTDLGSAKVIRGIGRQMQMTSLLELCDGLSPNFIRYFDLIAKYGFADKPDYEELRNCFRH